MRAIASLGCEWAIRAIASSMSPNVSLQQGSTPIISIATTGGRTAVQIVSAAAKTLPTTPTHERYIAARVKGYCTHTAIFTLLRCTTDDLALRAAGANQLLKPASTTPRSYGRRHRFWHHGHVHATHNERRRGQRPVHHDQVQAWRLGHRHGHHDQAPATHNERRRGKQPGRNDEVPATHNEHRREQWPEHHDHFFLALFNGESNNFI